MGDHMPPDMHLRRRPPRERLMLETIQKIENAFDLVVGYQIIRSKMEHQAWIQFQGAIKEIVCQAIENAIAIGGQPPVHGAD